jgi:hypothetical protein
MQPDDLHLKTIQSIIDNSNSYFPINHEYYVLSIKSAGDRLYKQLTSQHYINPTMILDLKEVESPVQTIHGVLNIDKMFNTLIYRFKSIHKLKILHQLLIGFKEKSKGFKGFPSFNTNIQDTPFPISYSQVVAPTPSPLKIPSSPSPIANLDNIVLIYRTLSLSEDEKKMLIDTLSNLSFMNEVDFWTGSTDAPVDSDSIVVYRRFNYKDELDKKFKVFQILKSDELKHILMYRKLHSQVGEITPSPTSSRSNLSKKKDESAINKKEDEEEGDSLDELTQDDIDNIKDKPWSDIK